MGRAELDLRKSRTSIELFNPEKTAVQTVPGESPVSTYEEFAALAEAYRPRQAHQGQGQGQGQGQDQDQDRRTFANRKIPPLPESDKSVYPDFSHGHRVQKLLNRLAPGGLPR